MSSSRIRTVDFNFQSTYCSNENTTADHLWFVLHGYGQLAHYFIKKFSFLEDKALVVAPQGLSLFYLQSTSGRVGASWMTKENRHMAITNYLSYLNQVYHTVLHERKSHPSSVTLLGFSQGVSTLIRWIVSSQISFDKLIMCAGSFPEDIDSAASKKIFSNKPCYYSYGDQDPYIKEGSMEQLNGKFQRYGLEVKFVKFAGKHEVPQSLIQKLIE
ncbi:putative esterase [Catalinimonas alkaloidigena]|uniref:alpha/beta hydrolase n=1 Tax=Catalinimonas alkaloidigena TaxID=1075417 RepID=UPI002404CDFF|nr:dienelactone hydrolase family protein [Catalinimonas alkaloidigena]MDF9799805.1 putative esterase [Catalinimonas alkaloidigena]